MPNHCLNEWRIFPADKEEFEEIKRTILNEEGNFDFNTLVPMPQIIKNTCLGHTDDGKPTSLYKDGIHKRKFTDQEYEELKKIGCWNWYDWSNLHWGTKWNAYGHLISHFDSKHNEIELHFETAWRPPTEIYRAFIKRFPRAGISAYYREDAMELAGFLTPDTVNHYDTKTESKPPKIDLDDAIKILNNILKADPKAITQLVSYRADCNTALRDHPTVQVACYTPDMMVVGLLGILNGIFTTETNEHGYIAVNMDEKTGNITNFFKFKLDQ